jgi:glycyl-tRNA synthetase beta chain
MMLHGSRVIPGDVLGVSSSNKTLGHRFLAGSAITLKHADDYERALRDKGRVVVDFATRRDEIEKQLHKAAGDATLVVSDPLLDEITAIVEAPTVYAGDFSTEFLTVPEECLILSMQQHQKYVPLRDKTAGKLLPRFLFVSNVEAKDPREIIHGNERVLRARLADAKFFYDQDRKTRLEARVPRLANVVYHNKLGSQLERIERIQLLAGKIARELSADPLLAERAAWLSKADLLTDMVGEFPELQGVMGRYYALNDGEPKTVADAIGAHYRPRFAGDALPDDPVSASVALAEKLDALAGLFGIGQVPTGDRDPFGLRRAALGVIRMLVERNLPLPLNELIKTAFSGFNGKVGDAHADLESFIYDRLSGYLKDQGYSTLEVESVISNRPVQINLVLRQLEAVHAFNRLPEAESLAAANKRVVNILKQAEAKGESFANVEREELKEPAERALFEALATASQKATSLFKQGDFTGYLKTFAVLKAPVDAFFDSIMVMVDDSDLRRSRLALLADLRKQMNRVADISKLAA